MIPSGRCALISLAFLAAALFSDRSPDTSDRFGATSSRGAGRKPLDAVLDEAKLSKFPSGYLDADRVYIDIPAHAEASEILFLFHVIEKAGHAGRTDGTFAFRPIAWTWRSAPDPVRMVLQVAA